MTGDSVTRGGGKSRTEAMWAPSRSQRGLMGLGPGEKAGWLPEHQTLAASGFTGCHSSQHTDSIGGGLRTGSVIQRIQP